MDLPALENVTRPIRAGPVIPSSFLSIYIIRGRFIFSVPTGIKANRRLAKPGSACARSFHGSRPYAFRPADVEVTVWPAWKHRGGAAAASFGVRGLVRALGRRLVAVECKRSVSG